MPTPMVMERRGRKVTPIDFRAVILDKMKRLSVSRNRLAELLDGEPGRTTIYSFLEGKNDMASKGVARILDVLEREEKKQGK